MEMNNLRQALKTAICQNSYNTQFVKTCRMHSSGKETFKIIYRYKMSSVIFWSSFSCDLILSKAYNAVNIPKIKNKIIWK